MKIFSLIFTLCFLTILPAQADNRTGLKLSKPYAFATMPGVKNGAVFVEIRNQSDKEIALVKAEAAVAQTIELHENLVDPDDGMMMMRKVRQINVPKKGSVTLRPDGYHVMLIGLKEALTLNSEFDMRFIFDDGRKIEKTVVVMPPGTAADGVADAPEITDPAARDLSLMDKIKRFFAEL